MLAILLIAIQILREMKTSIRGMKYNVYLKMVYGSGTNTNQPVGVELTP
jgi:hypothetical protein